MADPARPAHTARDDALDALRGVAVAGMAVVNLQVPGQGYVVLRHAAWNGLTLADIVFPVFLLGVGLATPLAIDRRGAALAGLLRRTALLFAIGVALSWLLRPTLDPAAIRVAGVLQRIALVYLACALACRVTRGWRALAGIALALMLAHVLLLHLPAPDTGRTTLAAGEGMSGWLDRLLVPGRLLRTGWDPEGALSTLSAIATALIGAAVQRARLRSVGRGVAAASCLLAAVALAPLLPLNKALWTPSFALATAGIGLALYALLALGRPPRLATALGQAALTFYVVHTLLIVLLIRRIDGITLWQHAAAAVGALGAAPPLASLLVALAAAVPCVAITLALRRRGWLVRA